MPAAYFVSDLHITSPDDARSVLFCRFLRRLRGVSGLSHLFLMGDIFDLWLADHEHFVAKYRLIIEEIEKLRDLGVEIHYFEGNHDLHLRRFWSDRLRLKVHEEPMYFDFNGSILRLEHGDQMDPEDRGYRFLRWLLRTPPMRYFICHMPPSLVVRLGERASKSSRSYTSQTKTISAQKALEKIRLHAQKTHAQRAFDVLVAGHVHVRDDFVSSDHGSPYRAINLGTWMDTPCYLKIDESGVCIFELDDTHFNNEYSQEN